MIATAAKVTVIPIQCARCKRYHDIGVRLVSMGCSEWCPQSAPHDEPDLRYEIPANCGCGEPLETYAHIRDVEEGALDIFTHGYPQEVA